MSYVVLARKYRPHNFSEVVGQEHVVRALSNALTEQRLHHAYLFTGTRGIGKTTISRILAKSLNCTGADGQGGITAEPCGVCPACRAIDAGNFVDYTELDAASNRGVDEVQGLLEQAVYKPVQGRFKVFMIDEVHMLSNTAFNAMLKTLEEPPEYLKFVLATTDPQKVPITVLSRCLQFNLRPMAPEVIKAQLVRILEQEGIAAEAPALRLLAAAAHGSMRDALSLTDQAIAHGSGAIDEAGVRAMLGSVDREVVFELLHALAAGDGARVVARADALRAAGQSAAAVLEDAARVLQRMAVAQAVPTLAAADDEDPDAAHIAALAGELPPDETQLLYSLCIHGRAELGLAPDEYVGLTMALLRLLPFRASADASTETAEKKTPLKAKQTKALATPAAAQPAPLAPERAVGAGRAKGSPSTATSEAAASAAEKPAQAPAVAPAATGTEPVPAPPADAQPAQELGTVMAVTASAATIAGPVAAVEVPSEARKNAPLTTTEPMPPAVESVTAETGPALTPNTSAEVSAPADAALGDFWAALVKQLAVENAIKGVVRQLALQTQLVARGDTAWALRTQSATLARPATVEALQAALAAAGHAVRLTVEERAAQDTPAQRRAAAKAECDAAAKALIESDPFVREMMLKYGAKIVPGSIRALQ